MTQIRAASSELKQQRNVAVHPNFQGEMKSRTFQKLRLLMRFEITENLLGSLVRAIAAVAVEIKSITSIVMCLGMSVRERRKHLRCNITQWKDSHFAIILFNVV